MNITLGEISTFLGLIAGIIASSSAIALYLQKGLKKVLKKELEPMSIQLQNLDVSQCKNFLVRFLADVEQGNELDEVEKERAYEIYDHYINDLKQNSYIHTRWEQLMIKSKKKGKKNGKD